MTTIKELKELDAKATSAPWYSDNKNNIWRRNPNELYEYGGDVAGDKPLAVSYVGWSGEGVTGYPSEENAKLIAATRNALPELIRVIELAEEALKQVNEKSHFVPAIVQEAISEIRKLKGE